MSQPNPEDKSQKQENIVNGNTIGRDLIFAPIQTDKYIETQIIEISAERVTQQRLIKTSPYKGLKKFNLGDREYFFGRDALIDKLLNAVNKSNFSLVLGASGSGKSSVVRAGLIPELKKSLNSQKFYDFIFTPNQNPFESLYRCLLSEEKDFHFKESDVDFIKEEKPNTLPQLISKLKKNEERWFIFIDQFEELFINIDLETRNNFIEGIVRVAKKGNSSVRIVLAMRSDFLEQFSFYPTLSAIANNNIHLVAEMYPDQLRQAIEQPAAKNGVVFEKGLVEQIIKEVEGQKGYLPLLQYTLDLIWEKECTTKVADGRFHIEDRTLNKTSYVAIGGVRGALQKRVDEIYKDICEKNEYGELVTKQIFLKLVNVVESESGSRAVSRRAYRNEFVGVPIESTLKTFVDQNLLVSNYEYSSEGKLSIGTTTKSIQYATIEIAHEILLSSWDKLKRWLEEEKETIILKNWLAGETKRWLKIQVKDNKKASDELLKGSRLDQIVEFRDKNAFEKLGGLTPEEEKFINASIESRRFVQQEKTRRQQRTIKLLLGVLTVVSITAVFAGWQWQQAQIGQIEALSTSSKTLFSTDPIASLIDGLKATKKLKQTFGANADLKAKVRFALIQAVYSIRESNRLENHKGNVNDITFSPDGKYLVSAGGDGTLRFWNLKGKEMKVWWGYNTRLLKISFNPKHKLIALADENSTIKLWSVAQEKIIKSFTGHQKEVTSLSFSPDGEKIVSGSSDGSIKLWDLNGKETLTIKEDNKRVNSIKFSPDGEKIVSGSSDGSIKLWDLNGKKIRTIKEDNDKVSNQGINSIDLNSDGTLIVSGSQDGVLKFWEHKGKLVRKVGKSNSNLKKSFSGISSVQLNPSRTAFAAAIGYSDGTVKIWSKDRLTTLGKHKNAVNSIKFSNDGKVIASASNDGTVKLWNLDRPRPDNFAPYQGDVGVTRFLSFSPNGKMIVTGSVKQAIDNYIIKVLKIGSRRNTFFTKGGKDELRSLHFNPKEEEIALGFQSGIIKILNLEGKELRVLDKHEKSINNLKFSPNGKTIVFGSNDGTIKLWNITNKKLYILGKHKEISIQNINFSPDGKFIVSGNGDSTIKIWNSKGKELHTLKGHISAVNSISFSPDGKIIASGSNNGIIKLWNLKGQEINTLWGHSGHIDSISFNLDGKMIVSGGSGKVKLWLLNDSIPITLVDSRGSSYSRTSTTQFSPDGNKLASTILNDKDKYNENIEVKLWNLEIDNLQSQGCYWIRNYLKTNPNLSKQDRQICKGAKKSAQALFQQGIALAKQGNIQEAIAKFQKASDINPNLNIKPRKEAIYIVARTYFDLAAYNFFSQDYKGAMKQLKIATELELKIGILNFNPEERARDLVVRGILKKGGALAVFEKSGATATIKRLKDIFNSRKEALLFPSAYDICWVGSLRGYASQALDACNKIVDLEPEPGRFKGIRGMAKAMSGDLKGAIEDFEANIIWLNSDRTKTEYTQESLKKLKQIRQNWIDRLRIGKNPFKPLTPKEIEKMFQITPK